MSLIKEIETPLKDSIVSLFESQYSNKNDAVSDYRNQAMQAFRKLGFPSIKNEEWRFTNVLPLIKTQFNLDIVTEIDAVAMQQATELLKANAVFNSDDAYAIVMVNGRYCPVLSTLPNVEGLTVCEINEAIAHPAFQANFGKILNIQDNAFAALNSALFEQGIFIAANANVVVEKPIHIHKVFTSSENKLFNTRNLFVLDKGAQFDVVVSYISAGEGLILVNSATEIAMAENAHCNHYYIQKTVANLRIIQRTEATQKRHSNYSNYTFTLPGAAFVRNNLALHLNDKEVESHLYGLYLTADNQLVDNHTEVHHKMPHGESNQLYKGIMMDKSKAVFNGKIYVYEDAQKTNAFQQSNNVLLSDHATVNAKPQLEIFADDVKCSHGTTIGQLNKDALFYLKSRGIGEVVAKQLMVKAFAFDVAEKIKIPALKYYVEALIESEMES